MLFVLFQGAMGKVRNKNLLPEWRKDDLLIRKLILETSGCRISRCDTYFWYPVWSLVNNWWKILQPVSRVFMFHRAEMIYYMYTASMYKPQIWISYLHTYSVWKTQKRKELLVFADSAMTLKACFSLW